MPGREDSPFADASSHGNEPKEATRLRVLIAEDERDAAATLEALIQDAGHLTRCVHRGREVLGAAHSFSADVVLLDIGLPGIDGYDIAKILRKVYGDRPKLIALTGRNAMPAKLMAKAAGFDYHFSKPYDPKELLAVLKQLAAEPTRRNA